MNREERRHLQTILIEYIENPRKMGPCILDIEDLFRTVNSRWNGYGRHKEGGVLLADEILESISEKYRIAINAIQGNGRGKRLLEARYEIIVQMNEAGYSYSEIGRTINRHPSTITHSMARINDET
jgi:chromosomal replication initiation ATPase DnaA